MKKIVSMEIKGINYRQLNIATLVGTATTAMITARMIVVPNPRMNLTTGAQK